MYSTVQYSTVQYSTVQYSTVQYSTVINCDYFFRRYFALFAAIGKTVWLLQFVLPSAAQYFI